MPNSGMSNILVPYQDQQQLTPFGQQWLQEKHRYFFCKSLYYRALKMVKASSMFPEQYKETKGFKDSWCAMIFCRAFEEDTAIFSSEAEDVKRTSQTDCV